MKFFLLIILGYLLGSIPFGKIVGYSKKIDIQKTGSGNIGFANSLRVMGWGPAAIVLVLDMAKGAVPVLVAKYFLISNPGIFYIGAAAVLGHIFPIWLKFKGGKGVATSIGASLVFTPWIGFGAIAVWTLVFIFSKISSIASLLGIAWLVLISAQFAKAYFGFYAIILIVILLTHRKNIRRLIKGTEKRTL